MNKIITMVGTSLYENYFEENRNDSIRDYYKDLEEKRAEEYASEKDRIGTIETKIRKWVKEEINKGEKEKLSAEIKSLLKIKQETTEDIEIYLLTSDTVLSKLAGELIKEILPNLGFDSGRVYIKIIKGLQIWDRNEFNNGMKNLINEIYGIANEYWDNVIINITGGYKATIPYLTILAQVNRCTIYYIFENTDSLIEIPYIPLDIKWNLFERYEEFFAKLEREGVCDIQGIREEDYKEILSLVEKADNLYSLNHLGIVLWEKYKQRFEIFNVSELLEEYIDKHSYYKNIAEKSLLELKRRIRQNPKDPDLDHRLGGVDLEGFKCFKHKESNLQVRVLYKAQERKTRYETIEYDIYAGVIRIGSDVHNVENEYIDDFKNNVAKIKDTKKYKIYKIQKEA